jgi:hypothetical protein
MKRHYYLSDDLDDLDHIEQELEAEGLTAPQMHVLSRDDAGVALHEHLHPVEAVLKKDVVRGTEVGAVVGVIGASLVLAVSYYSGVTATVGWVPFGFLAVVVLGFCTWEGGLFGIQKPHVDFARFEADLDAGKHVFFVDLDDVHEAALSRIVSAHPRLEAAGEGTATPKVVVEAQKKFHDTMQTLP